jgi:hypothetical protein
MTALGINNPNSKWMREYNGRNGGSIAQPPTLRQQLNSSYTAQMMKARAVRGSRKPSDVAMVKRAEAQMADISEQLTLLDAIEFGFIKPVIGGAMKLAGVK